MPIDVRMTPSPNWKAASIALAKVGREVANLTPVFERMLPQFASALSGTLRSGGEGWPPPGEAYVLRKRREGFSTRPMIRTKALVDEVASARRGLRKMTRSRVDFGPTAKYGFVQHYSGRPWIHWTDELERLAHEYVLEHVAEQLERAQLAIAVV